MHTIQGDSSVAHIIPGICLIENEMISIHSCLPNEDVEEPVGCHYNTNIMDCQVVLHVHTHTHTHCLKVHYGRRGKRERKTEIDRDKERERDKRERQETYRERERGQREDTQVIGLGPTYKGNGNENPTKKP